ncbi:UMP kinase [Patescibacteria group bacterium]
MDRPKFKRVLLKLSGTVFGGDNGQGIDPAAVAATASVIKNAKASGVEIAIVNGGGNLFRYRQVKDTKMRRIYADSIGMIGTMMNALSLQDMLEQAGVPTVVHSSVEVSNVVKPFVIQDAQQDLADGQVVIICGGTGHPFFTTDTAAVLRALEVEADAVLKATDVDGVYDDNPKENPNAKRFPEVTFKKALEGNLKIMDATAFALAQENELPIIVFNFSAAGALSDVLQGKEIGTLVHI